MVDDEQRCNFCVYWTGKRTETELFDWDGFDTAEWGIYLCQKAFGYGQARASCEGCTNCEDVKSMSQTTILKGLLFKNLKKDVRSVDFNKKVCL